MSFLDDVRTDREDLARVLKKHKGIRRTVEGLYPATAHFVYELLQNAEDAGASAASFVLSSEGLVFEHDGRPFDEKDIWAITDIGEGSKAGEEDKIGRFGIGFKAVFAYCETPRIWSPTYSFEISDFVLPRALMAQPELGRRTRFEFPFNNPKKAAQEAHGEVEAALRGLAETALLFLAHIRSISWQTEGVSTGAVSRVAHSEHHLEIVNEIAGGTGGSYHFLFFSEPVEGMKSQRVAIAFLLEFLPEVATFNPRGRIAKQLRVAPATPGRVAVFFPAEKEASGLRFHLHAPFVPELSRASVKDAPANAPLYEQIARLAAGSLHTIRDLELLTADFLSVLPNPQDVLSPRYRCIRASMVAEMNDQALTPTHSKTHAPAKHLLRAGAALKALLTDTDLQVLVDNKGVPPQWAVGVSLRNSPADHFLSGLAITEWDTPNFIELLCGKLGSWGSNDGRCQVVSPDEVAAWLGEKPVAWHQQLYALLHAEVVAGREYMKRQWLDRLKTLRIIRLSTGAYSVGPHCYFPTDEVEHDDVLPRVAKAIYSSGKANAMQDDARAFLVEAGVREVGEAELIEAILRQRYRHGAFKPDISDLERFVVLVEKDLEKACLFAGYSVFRAMDGDWRQPRQVFLSSPFADTGLEIYFDACGETVSHWGLSTDYQNCAVSVERTAKFAEAAGAMTHLGVRPLSCVTNPEWAALCADECVKPNNDKYARVDQDFDIPEFGTLTRLGTVGAGRLIWRTMTNFVAAEHLKATYRRNNWSPCKAGKSQLIHRLVAAAWVPQGDGKLVTPPDADRSLLPSGFAFDEGYEWLKAVGFGGRVRQRSVAERRKDDLAKELGFADEETLADAQWFARLDREQRRRFKSEMTREQEIEPPDDEPADPMRRGGNVRRGACDAPERSTEDRERSVAVGLDGVKEEAEQYLRQQYTNADDVMFCQVCKGPLPFRLASGRYYVDKVEFLPELVRRHYQNYLALCPNHAAMFQYANGSRATMKEAFLALASQHLQVTLAGTEETIYFTKKHVADLRDVIAAEQDDPSRPLS